MIHTNNGFHEMHETELMALDGGGWLEDLWDDAKKFGKKIGYVAAIEPAYDFIKGIKKGWDGYGK